MKEYSDYFKKNLDITETDALKISRKLLNLTAKEYSNLRKTIFANNEFYNHLIDFCNANATNAVIRNCLFVIFHVSRMYQFYPQQAFEFIWRYREEKALIYPVARASYVYPQFLQQQDYEKLLITLPTVAPKKNSMSLFYFIVSDILPKIEDIKFLNQLSDIFKSFIARNPNLYESKHQYPNLIKEIEFRIQAI